MDRNSPPSPHPDREIRDRRRPRVPAGLQSIARAVELPVRSVAGRGVDLVVRGRIVSTTRDQQCGDPGPVRHTQTLPPFGRALRRAPSLLDCYLRRVRHRTALALALTLAVIPPAAARAQLRAGSWREIFDAERRLGVFYKQSGLARLLEGLDANALSPELGDLPAHLLLDQALIRFERARRRMPDDPELAYFIAIALTRYERPAPDGGTEHRIDEAIDAWQRLRALDPNYHADRVAYWLASLHMRRQEFREARAEFELALQHAVPRSVDLMDRAYVAAPTDHRLAELFEPIEPTAVYGNLAEAAMLTGDLASAIQYYRAAAADSSSPLTRCLALWGLALASDRSGAHEDALRYAARAIRADPVPAVMRASWQAASRDHGPFAVLHLDGVFFEPRYEIHAYEALGHEARARPEAGSVDTAELGEALSSWRFFLAEGGASSRWGAIARAHVERLEAELAAASNPRRGPAGRPPRPRANR